MRDIVRGKEIGESITKTKIEIEGLSANAYACFPVPVAASIILDPFLGLAKSTTKALSLVAVPKVRHPKTAL